MGQSGLFMSNRQGTFQKWAGVWDSNKSYMRIFIENNFIKKAIFLILRNRASLSWMLLTKNYLNFLEKKINIKKYNNNLFLFSSIFRKKMVFRALFVLFGRFWLLRIDNWVVVCIFFFRPRKYNKKNFTVIGKKKSTNFFKKKVFNLVGAILTNSLKKSNNLF